MRRFLSLPRLLLGLLLVAGFRLSGIEASAPAASEPLSATPGETAVDLRKVFPAPGSVEVCPDAPLTLRFDGPIALGQAGKITLHELETGAVVDEVDVAAPTARKMIGGAGPFVYSPVVLDGNEAHVQFRNGILASF
jgi:hypothetical protein